MTTLTDAERESLRAGLAKWSKSEGRVGAMLLRDVGPAVTEIIAARETALREAIAAAMSETFADRVTWDDGTEYIATEAAARIARQARP